MFVAHVKLSHWQLLLALILLEFHSERDVWGLVLGIENLIFYIKNLFFRSRLGEVGLGLVLAVVPLVHDAGGEANDISCLSKASLRNSRRYSI